MFVPPFTVDFLHFIFCCESEYYWAFSRQIFPVIGKSSGGFLVFIEHSDFGFVDGETNPPISS